MKINDFIEALPASMLDSNNIEKTFNEASRIFNMYNQLSNKDKKLIDMSKVYTLLDGNSDTLNLNYVKCQSSF